MAVLLPLVCDMIYSIVEAIEGKTVPKYFFVSPIILTLTMVIITVCYMTLLCTRY